VGTESGEMCVSYFTLRTFITSMEIIKDLYQAPTAIYPLPGGGEMHRIRF